MTDVSTATNVDVDLSVTYLGLTLPSPIIASSSPMTRQVETMVRLQEAGVGAIVLPSLFQEEVEAEEMAAMDLMDMGDGFAEFDSAPLGDVDTSGLGPDRHVQLVAHAKNALTVPVIASVNATASGAWARYAGMMADAGADAVELNLYAVNADRSEDAAAVEQRYLDAIAEVKRAISVPLTVKLSQNYLSLSNFVPRAKDAGADGFVLFNRFLGPDLDLEDLKVLPKATLSTPVELSLRLRWAGILRSQDPDLSLAVTGGVHNPDDVLKSIMVGADVACVASTLLINGPGRVRVLIEGVRDWLVEHDYSSVRQMRGSMSAGSVDNPGDYERAQYIQAITANWPKNW